MLIIELFKFPAFLEKINLIFLTFLYGHYVIGFIIRFYFSIIEGNTWVKIALLINDSLSHTYRSLTF